MANSNRYQKLKNDLNPLSKLNGHLANFLSWYIADIEHNIGKEGICNIVNNIPLDENEHILACWTHYTDSDDVMPRNNLKHAFNLYNRILANKYSWNEIYTAINGHICVNLEDLFRDDSYRNMSAYLSSGKAYVANNDIASKWVVKTGFLGKEVETITCTLFVHKKLVSCNLL